MRLQLVLVFLGICYALLYNPINLHASYLNPSKRFFKKVFQGQELPDFFIINGLLDHVNFRKANLTRANFNNSTVIHTYFNEANLTSAKFTYANVYKSDFYQTNFQKADLSHSYFRNVSFAKADFRGANLTGVICELCRFNKVIFNHTTILPFTKEEALSFGMVEMNESIR